ncbi:MAG TPA: tetratricopeptide repeat protein [Baekduia sp.]|nr:tetratricopeptide repeat protein [Baekduia sp.]
MTIDPEWERRSSELWSLLDDLDPQEFRARIDALAGELADDDPVGLFERGCANDSTGRPEVAVPLYRQALERGLTGIRRRRAVIQMASSLRNLGEAQTSVELLRAERERGSDDLDDAVVATLALALADTGRPREAAGLAIGALARHLPRYNRSMADYARALADGGDVGARA